DFGGTKWERALPNVPSFSDGAGVFTPPLDDASTLWLQLNAELTVGGPLLLLGGYLQATFATDVAALKSAFAAWRSAGVVVGIALQERNEIQDKIQPVLVGYRKKLPTQFPKGHPIVNSLPDVTPAPGSTPEAVVISGVWDSTLQQARITFTPTAATDVLRFELRFCSGSNYNTDVESVISSLLPEAIPQFATLASLTSPGNVASFKVYVITTTGNEKGSNAATVTRPAI
ncbi:MAG: hypothetical protein H7Z17_11325, partial [Fuerstia sp.]|nr:hypothetical protein [Fuerstiella sp.]